MDSGKLEEYLKRMSMTHVYQPVMIKRLLESGGEATVEDIAKEFIDMDASLLRYYMGRVMVWPKKTLEKHKVVKYEKGPRRGKGRFTLLVDGISEEARNRLVEICDLRTAQFVDKFGERYGAKGTRDPVPGALQYDILARDKRCMACGVDRPLEVDHIVPVNMGGKTEPGNLQALCGRCNRQKGDRDKTDFVGWSMRLRRRKKGCLLCGAMPVASNTFAAAARSASPASRLHSLVFPKRHVGEIAEMIPAERNLCLELAEEVKAGILLDHGAVAEFDVNVGRGGSCGRGHLWIDVIPHWGA